MTTALHQAQRFGTERPSEDPYNQSATPFIEGIIRSVDPDRWTVEVKTLGLDQPLQDVRIMSPYFSFESGQGIFQLPEVGSMCVVSRTQSDWFVVGFIPPSDVDGTEDDEAEEDTTSTQNLSDTFLGQIAAIQAKATKRNVVEDKVPSPHSFRANREGDMIAGDGCLKSRAGNKIKWFTNGNILVEASKLCQRIWSRLQNRIIDVATRYDLLTPGVQKTITLDEESGDVLEVIAVRVNATDELPTLQIKRGKVSDDENFEFLVQDQSGNEKMRVGVKNDGEHVMTIGESSSPVVTVEAKPNGEYNILANGDVKVESQSEVIVNAPSVIAGEGGEDILVKFTALEGKVNSHLHDFIDANGNPKVTQQPTIPIMDSSDSTTKLKGG
jgi:hypothetical protein